MTLWVFPKFYFASSGISMDPASPASSGLDRLSMLFYLCLIIELEKTFSLQNAQCGSWDCFHRLVILVKKEGINFSSIAKIILD